MALATEIFVESQPVPVPKPKDWKLRASVALLLTSPRDKDTKAVLPERANSALRKILHILPCEWKKDFEMIILQRYASNSSAL